MKVVLLLGMPDVASSFDRVMRMPNLGIASIAANLDEVEVHVLDLVLFPKGVGKTVREYLQKIQPDVVGLSAMTFQYDTAKQIAAIVREVRPEAKTVLGGYHATLACEQISQDTEAHVFDFLVRGEGETPMNELMKELEGECNFSRIPGLSYRENGEFIHNRQADLVDLSEIKLPARRARLARSFRYFGKRFDVIETSRGCLKSCRFCSIQNMYGRSYRCYPIKRVIADIADARANGAKGIFFVDDNITLQPGRLKELCDAIVEAELDDLDYISQADVAGFLNDPELTDAMHRAGFKGIFLGIESVSERNYGFLKKKNAPDDTLKVVKALRERKIAVAGGLIVGNPDEDEQAIRDAFKTALVLPLDHAIMWCLTPYPGTEAREMLLKEWLVENPDDFRCYNGFICNVRTRNMTHDALVRAIAREGSKLYFNPRFFLRSSTWPKTPKNAWIYFRTVAEYLVNARKNRLFASRHRL